MANAEVYLNDSEYAIAAAKHNLSNSNLSPEDTRGTSYVLGKLLIKRGRISEGISYLEAEAKANPDIINFWADFWADLGEALVRNGRIDAGIEALRKGIDIDSSSPSLHVRLGDALAAKGDLAGQETEYKAACNLDTNDPLLANQNASRFIALAKLQIIRGEFEGADVNLDKALQLDPNALYAYLVRAQLLEKKGQVSEAQAQRNKAEAILVEERRKEKKNEPLDTSAPLVVFVENDPRETVRILEPLRDSLTGFDKVMLALAYFDLGRKDDGIGEFEKAFAADPKVDTAQAHFTFAEALKKAGLSQKAEEHYRRASEMDPENTTYRYEYEAIRKSR